MKQKGLRRFAGMNGLLIVLGLLGAACGDGSEGRETGPAAETTTPIRHLIVVIGENHSFDNIFGVYVPREGQNIWNLLSQEIVTLDGLPGPNFSLAAQQQAEDLDVYELSPGQTDPFSSLPRPNLGLNAITYPLSTHYGITEDPGLDSLSQSLLSEGGTGRLILLPDLRFPAGLPNGPFQITRYVDYTATTGDPVHRFYQMWQQSDCSSLHITDRNPSGCNSDLYSWVAVSVGWGSFFPSLPPPKHLTDQTTFQGGVQMGFYNMARGDLPYFSYLADLYAISDNFHQSIMGGTGPNHTAIGTADMIFYSSSTGSPVPPPPDQIEDPNPYPGSNNWYRNDGLNLADPGDTSIGGYSECSDPAQPGVAAVLDYLDSLPYEPFNGGGCAPGAYYLLNNDLPAYNRDGSLRSDLGSYTPGPSSVPTIGDALSAKGISWKYYGEGFGETSPVHDFYCEVCNPFQYSMSIMTTDLRENIQGLDRLYTDLESGALPAVSFVKPDSLTDGHPGTSLTALFEAFCRKLINALQVTDLWETSAVLILFDETGGYYDSGTIQPVDFFGDGPRVPLIAVSPFAKEGFVDHTYADHASIVKFIERNWALGPLSGRSRDNLPNPLPGAGASYFPANSPAIGDLTTLFDFTR